MFCLRNRCRVAALVLIVAGVCALPSQVVAEPAGPSAPLEALTELERMQLASPLAAPVAAASALDSLSIAAPFPSPADRPRGLEHDGTYLYVAQASTEDFIFKIDPATNATVDTYPWTVTFFPIGIAWDGTYFYVSDDTAGNIYVVDTDFEFLWALPAPETWQRDLAFDGTHLLEATVFTDKVWTLETAHGNVIDSFDAPMIDRQDWPGMGPIYGFATPFRTSSTSSTPLATFWSNIKRPDPIRRAWHSMKIICGS